MDPDGRDYMVCVYNEDGSETCINYASLSALQAALQGTGATLSGTNSGGQIDVNVNGQNQVAGTYQYWAGPATDGVGLQPEPIADSIIGAVGGWAVRAGGFLIGMFEGVSEGAAEGGTVAVARGGIGPVLKGAQGVERAIAEVESEGGTVLGREITIDTPAARVRADFVYRDANGDLVIGEAKNGSTASLSANQRAGYSAIRNSGGELVGGNARSAGLPSIIGPTQVRIFAYH